MFRCYLQLHQAIQKADLLKEYKNNVINIFSFKINILTFEVNIYVKSKLV